MRCNTVHITAQTSKDLLYDKNLPVLFWQIIYPVFSSCTYPDQAQQLNVWYYSRTLDLRRRLLGELFPDAVRAREEGATALPYEAISVFKSTWNKGCLESLYTDNYEYTGGAHGNTVRMAETWNLKTGKQVSLCELFPSQADCRAYMLQQINEQIDKQPDIYFDNAKQLAEEYFDPLHFYMTPEGVVLFYQQYEIAPYSSGIRTFTIPYGGDPVQLLCGGEESTEE